MKIVPNGYNSFKAVSTKNYNTRVCFVATAFILLIVGFALPNDFEVAKVICFGLGTLVALAGIILKD